ncbi:MAG: MoaD/ThiS family protein [Candidatus Bipolaricaulis sp.]|nr:MoaD/ThiS family protein [Candidatus Bipolaricaulis sp.]MDD5646092.1 MoaD/ThiS family protein [Candidatus Bipolaricaulis sp.]
MSIEVRLHGTLAATRPGLRAGDPFPVELSGDATVADLVAALTLAPEDAHLVIVNGRILHDRAAVLAEGDRVGLFPPTGGG